jgi:ribosome modulation factor
MGNKYEVLMLSEVFLLLIWCYVPSMGNYFVILAYRIFWMKKHTIHYKATMKNMDTRPCPYEGSNLRSHFLNSLRPCYLDSTT